MGSWLKSRLENLLDFRIALIVLLIAVSTGHVGRVFADREAAEQNFIGYLLALAIDGVLAISLYEVAYAERQGHRRLAMGGFVVACSISAGFNIYYYRLFHPGDHVLLSALLGATAPVMAAFLALLKSRGDVQRRKAQDVLELEKFRIEQEEQTKKAVALEAEKTKQLKERTKQRRLKMQAEEKTAQEVERERQSEANQRQLVASLGKSLDILRHIVANPGQSTEEVGEAIGIKPRTVGYHLAKLEQKGAIARNGQGIQVLWEAAIINEGQEI